MKWHHVNIANIHDLVPKWAIEPVDLAHTLDRLLASEAGLALLPAAGSVYSPLAFWIEVDLIASPPTVRVCTPDEAVDLCGQLIIISSSPFFSHSQLELPLNPILKDYVPIGHSYSVYIHSFQTDVPLAYVGMTRQRWFDRLGQHVASSRAGSPYLFHRAIAQHPNVSVLHKVLLCELDHDNALQYEEQFVAQLSLYPLGLNMIPGGRAGFAYLAQLGFHPANAGERDRLIERLSSREAVEGRPNPLCAARWANDPGFAERVICGHSGRLTVEQVRQVRAGASVGKTASEIFSDVGARTRRQVLNVISGRTYQRIAPRAPEGRYRGGPA